MVLKEKLRIISDKLKEMQIDGSSDTARSMKAPSNRYSSAYAEALDIHEKMKDIANSPSSRDISIFDNLATQLVALWGKVFNTKANELLPTYATKKDIPKNVFRSCSPNKVSLDGRLGGNKIKIIPFRSSKVKRDDVVYTVDEIDEIKIHQMNKKALNAVHSVKKTFPGSYVITNFDRVLHDIQLNGAKSYERNRFSKRNKNVNKETPAGTIRLPLEEQQRYTSRSS